MSDIIEKIKALRSKIPENGATEGEAMHALEMAQRLMEKHQISEADLNRRDFENIMAQAEMDQPQKQIHPAYKFCGARVEQFCGLVVWQSYNRQRKKTLKLFGYKEDVEMAEYLLELIKGSMDRGWKEYVKTHPKRRDVSRHIEYWSFMVGFAERVNEKIEELAQKTEVTTGTDLVATKTAVVQEALNTLLPGLKLRVSNGQQAVQAAAYGKGQEAGDKINLNRPLSERQQGRMLK